MPSGGGASARPAADSARGGGSARSHEVSSSSGRTSAISSMRPDRRPASAAPAAPGCREGPRQESRPGHVEQLPAHSARFCFGSGWPGCRSSGSAENRRAGRAAGSGGRTRQRRASWSGSVACGGRCSGRGRPARGAGRRRPPRGGRGTGGGRAARARARAGRSRGGQPIQRSPAGERSPPGATQCRCGWNCSAEPHVCRTARKPMRAPRCLGSAAPVCKVSAAAWKRMPRTTRLFWWAMAAISRGRVKTTWNVWFAPRVCVQGSASREGAGLHECIRPLSGTHV